MAKSKKPRKPYNPNKVLSNNPMTVMTRYSKEEGDSLKYRIYFHLHRLTTNVGDSGDYLAIMFRLKIGQGLAKYFKDALQDLNDQFDQCMKIMDEIKIRRISGEKWFVNINEETIIRETLAIIDDIQDKTTRSEQLPVFVKAQETLDHKLREVYP